MVVSTDCFGEGSTRSGFGCERDGGSEVECLWATSVSSESGEVDHLDPCRFWRLVSLGQLLQVGAGEFGVG